MTNNNSGLVMEEGDKDIRLKTISNDSTHRKEGLTLMNYYDEENEGLNSNEETVINDVYEREGKQIFEEIVIEDDDEGELKRIYQDNLIEDSFESYMGKNY